MTEAMKITVVVDVPADTTVTRQDLIDILMYVPYAPDKAMMKPIGPGKGGKDRYTTGPFAGVKTKWFSEEATPTTEVSGNPEQEG